MSPSSTASSVAASQLEVPLKLAILQTDSVIAEYQPRHGDYPDMFVQLLGAAGIDANQVDSFDVRHDQYPNPTDYAGYVITGSKSSVYDADPWIATLADFVGLAVQAGRKVVGICFGHQLLAHFFGGKVGVADTGWVVGTQRNSFATQLPWMEPAADCLSMLSSHQDQVQALPLEATLIASTDRCPMAGFVVGDTVLALQSHPEFSAAYLADLMRTRAGILGPTVLSQGLDSLTVPTDNSIAGQWIANFLRHKPSTHANADAVAATNAASAKMPLADDSNAG